MRKFSILMVLVLLLTAAMPVFGAPAQQETTLKMGLLPILDVLPFYVATDAGYFDEAGLDVELVPVSSALERDQLMLAGEIDGMLNDLISTGIFNQDETRIQIVAQARRAYPDAPQFRILAAPGSEISAPADLAGVEIGISENSVIHYIAQRILEDAGLSADDLEFRAEPNIPVRFQLLMEGAIQAACLPDPLAQAAIEGGAVLVADDTALVDEEFSQSVLSFRTGIIEDQPEAVEAFVAAWMQAAEDLNADPDAYRDLWLENTTVPDSVADSYVLPPFPTYAITQPLAWEDTMTWLEDEDIVDNAPGYQDSINPEPLAALTRPVVDEEEVEPDDVEITDLPGDPDNGAVLFANYGCSGCHAVDDPDAAGVGPSLAGFAARAGETVADLDTLAYTAEAILEPDAFVVEGYAEGVMPAYDLPETELNDLVAYLLTLE